MTAPDVLTGKDAYFCSKCGGLCEASSQALISQFPPVLVVHIARFRANLYRAYKVSTNVALPTVLDLAPFADPLALRAAQAVTYRLVGVSEHIGALSHGHYTARFSYPDTSKWYDCSDTHVRPVEGPDDVYVSDSVYLAFYQREIKKEPQQKKDENEKKPEEEK